MTREPLAGLPLQRISIPDIPARLKHEYASPAEGIQQVFRWHRNHHEWQLTLVDPESIHAGLFLRRPLHIPETYEQLALYFELHPRTSAEHLALGLLDHTNRDQAEETATVPIAAYEVRSHDETAIGFL